MVTQLSELEDSNKVALKEKDLRQLLQVRLTLRQELLDQQIPWGKKLLQKLDLQKDKLIKTQYPSSDLHKDVAKALDPLVHFEEEQFIDFISCDCLLEQDKTVIEIHGPSHYLEGSNQLDGHSLLKLRLLQKQGYTTIVIPYWEWDALDTHEEKKGYLKARLEQLVSCKEPVVSLSLKDDIEEKI